MNSTKMIKVLNRCIVITSRGRVVAPISRPYSEDVSYIFGMISRDGAEVFEVLADNTEVKLDENNFDKDNSIKVVEVTQSVAPVEEVSQDKSTVTNQAQNNQQKWNNNNKGQNNNQKNNNQQKPQVIVNKPVEQKPVEQPVVESTTSETEVDSVVEQA